jgi:translation initiation factor 2-alpha kinase 4
MNVNNFELRITHTNILSSILKHCGVPKHKIILSTLENLNKPLHFSEIRTQLRKHGVSNTSLDSLSKFNFESKPVDQGIEQLKTLMPCADLNCEIQELTTLTTFLTHLGIKSNISLIPLLSYNFNYYKGGIIFQIVHGQKKKLGTKFNL